MTEKIIRVENSMEFSAKQPKQTKCKGGKEVLLLTNERVEQRVSESMAGEEPTTVEVYIYDGRWVNVERTNGDLLAAVKLGKQEEIDAYDTSSAVNGLFLNGKLTWVELEQRKSLMNSTQAAKNLGRDTTTFWFSDQEMTLSCDKTIQLLSVLEMYALDCANVTAAHKKDVEELTSVDDVLAYDVTRGYPDRLVLKTTE